MKAAGTFDVATPYARIAVADGGGDKPPVLLIHGNSACKEIFARQFESPLAQHYRFVAFDLPGHGASSDATDPEATYCMTGYADVALALLAHLKIGRCAVFGWSLGGHIGIEMLSRDVDIAGLAITGTPPIGHNPEDFAAGFKPVEHMDLTGKEQFTEADAIAYARETAGSSAPFLEAAVRRTDGRARRLMLAAAMAGRGADQRRVVETNPTPLAVITGADEPFVDNRFLERLAYRNLWDGRVHVLERTGHAPFWERPDAFNTLFARFLGDVLP